MVTILIYIIAGFITVPIIVTYIMYHLNVVIYKHSRKAFHVAINWTTTLYIISVLVLLFMLFGKVYIGTISLLLLFILTSIIVIQWKTKMAVSMQLALKLLWRICFMFFFLAYSFLVLFGIIQRVFW